MEGLTSLLPKILLGAGGSDDAREHCVYAAWVAVVGSQVSRVTAPVGLRQRRLVVAVLDDSWRVQLKKMSGQIAFKINALLGTAVVRTIDLVVNEKKVHAVHPSQPPITFSAPAEYALPLREKAILIPDQDLREAFLRAAGKCLERTSTSAGQSTDGARTNHSN